MEEAQKEKGGGFERNVLTLLPKISRKFFPCHRRDNYVITLTSPAWVSSYVHCLAACCTPTKCTYRLCMTLLSGKPGDCSISAPLKYIYLWMSPFNANSSSATLLTNDHHCKLIAASSFHVGTPILSKFERAILDLHLF